jgi:hypothetical protein
MLTNDEIRVLGLCAPIIVRMLKGREEKIISRIYGEFRNGKTDHLSSLAEIACIRDQIHEINAAVGRVEQEKRNE